MKRTEYRTSPQSGFNRVDLFMGRTLVGLVHYLKTKKLAVEVTDALNAAYWRGVADGFEAARAEIRDYASVDFRGDDPAEKLAEWIDLKNVKYED